MSRDVEELGRRIARRLEWDTDAIYRLAYAALVEANAHDIAALLKEAYEEISDRERRDLEAEWWAAGQSCGMGD